MPEYLEEHFAECDECTAQARQFRIFTEVWNSWTASAHGEAYRRAAQQPERTQGETTETILARALQTAQERAKDLDWQKRLRQWREHRHGKAGATVQVIREAPGKALRVVAERLETLNQGKTMIDCDWIFRVLDISEFDSKEKQLYIGTGFLVSSKGYALTTWHNFDYDFELEKFDDEREISNLRIAPRWGSATDEHNWTRVKVVGRWSNPAEDFAVIKLEREAIQKFELRPAPLALTMLPRLGGVCVWGRLRIGCIRTRKGSLCQSIP